MSFPKTKQYAIYKIEMVAKTYDIKAELIAMFGPNGEFLSFDATQGGDLNTPYYGHRERVSRSGYQKIENMRIPMTFEISRIGKKRDRPTLLAGTHSGHNICPLNAKHPRIKILRGCVPSCFQRQEPILFFQMIAHQHFCNLHCVQGRAFA